MRRGWSWLVVVGRGSAGAVDAARLSIIPLAPGPLVDRQTLTREPTTHIGDGVVLHEPEDLGHDAGVVVAEVMRVSAISAVNRRFVVGRWRRRPEVPQRDDRLHLGVR